MEYIQASLDLIRNLPDQARGVFEAGLGLMGIGSHTVQEGFDGYLCVLKMREETCLPCTLVSLLNKLGREVPALRKQTDELTGEMRSKEEVYCNAVQVDDETEMARGVRALTLNGGLYDKLNKLFANKAAGGDFTHPERGFDLVFEKDVDKSKQIPMRNSGKTFSKTTYDVSAARNSSPLRDMGWLKQMHDLSKVRREIDANVFKGWFEGPEDKKAAAPSSRQLPPAGQGGKPGDWIENPDQPGDWDTRENLRKRGVNV